MRNAGVRVVITLAVGTSVPRGTSPPPWTITGMPLAWGTANTCFFLISVAQGVRVGRGALGDISSAALFVVGGVSALPITWTFAPRYFSSRY